MTTCLDLLADYGAVYRIAHEEQAAQWPRTGSDAILVALAMAKVFAEDNPNFKRDKFLAACGITVPNA